MKDPFIGEMIICREGIYGDKMCTCMQNVVLFLLVLIFVKLQCLLYDQPPQITQTMHHLM